MSTVHSEIKAAEIAALRRAIEVERRARYVDFQGRRSTFSQFMRTTADRLCRQHPSDTRWATIRGLMRQYANLDVATRISILRRVEELIAALPDAGPCRQPDGGSAGLKVSGSSLPAAPPGKERATEVKDRPPPGATDRQACAPAKPSGGGTDAARMDRARPGQAGSGARDVQFVRGVGPKMALLLNNLGIYTVDDLIRHYPRRHLDFQNRLRISELRPGQEVTVVGTIRSVGAFQSRNGRVSVVTILIHDGTGGITVTRFIGGKANKLLLDRYKDQYPKGASVLASGVVEVDRFKGRLKLSNAELEILSGAVDTEEDGHSIHTGRLVPVYPLTEGVGLRYLRTIIYNALETHLEKIDDPLPRQMRSRYDLVDLDLALKSIHFPEDLEAWERARRRIVFDELFAIQLALALRRQKADAGDSGLRLGLAPDGLVDRFRRILPFQLTKAQERVFCEIAADMAATKPMHRLVQGDVGSGKTVVAIMAFLIAIENGYQGAMMAPTEILAEQHYRQLVRYLTPLGLRCALLTGNKGQKERRLTAQDLLSGQIHVAVGTHALIQEGVEFGNLGLIIIDEQHRFGVRQRAMLKGKGVNPELISMTATPIPRTLALTLHGDLDISEIDEMPPGRQPIDTRLFTAGQKRHLWDAVKAEVAGGRQAYIVFPLIEESETLSAKAAAAEFEKLRTTTFSDLTLGLMHGKLKAEEKEEVMERFRCGEIDVLVATTVIEVGVDVPNASIMVIENADRFGLAQLHQLRGRVGRGPYKSYCFLVADLKSDSTRQRLEIMTQTNDGFVIAQKDLELRGPGEFLGTRQSGLPDIVLADLVKDAKTLEQAREAALLVVRSDPGLSRHPRLKRIAELGLSGAQTDLIGSG